MTDAELLEIPEVFMGMLTLSQMSSQTMLHHVNAFIEGLNSVVMIYITVVAQLDGGPRECHNQINQPINVARKGKAPRPYLILEQIHNVLITDLQTYTIIRLSMLCPSGVIILDDRLALPSECFVSMTFFSFGLLLCIIFEESLLKFTPHHVDSYQFHIQRLFNSVISLSIRRSDSSKLSFSIQILSFF